MQTSTPRPSARRGVAAWLLVCAAMVFAMVVVGGVTRLTHSGLSIVEWQPLVGTVPPLNDADWHDLFDKYKQTPEFKQVNHAMDLAGFKRIFWWEYFHRLLGRTIGAVFLIPFLWFLVRRHIDRPLAWQLAGIFALGALQGALGWFMVKSGLVDDPRVSSLRLAAHLGTAFLIYASMLWLALGLACGMRPRREQPARRHAAACAHHDRDDECGFERFTKYDDGGPEHDSSLGVQGALCARFVELAHEFVCTGLEWTNGDRAFAAAGNHLLDPQRTALEFLRRGVPVFDHQSDPLARRHCDLARLETVVLDA